MAQADGVVANGTGAAVRSDLNGQLAALFTNHSGSTSPATTYAHQFWADTNENVLKIRNAANNAWITLRELDGTMLIEDGTAAAPGLAFADDTNTGIHSPAADHFGITTGGTQRVLFKNDLTVFNDGGGDVDFRVESDDNTHMLFVDAGNNRIGINTASPGFKLHCVESGSAAAICASSDVSADALASRLALGNSVGTARFTINMKGGGSELAYLGGEGNFPFYFQTNGAERMRLDGTGRLLIGHSSSRSSANASHPHFQMEGINVSTSTAAIVRNENAANGPILALSKSRGTSTGSNTIVQSGDITGAIHFAGADGTDLNSFTAWIQSEVDGTPGGNDMPGRLAFYTTADGANSPTERVRIDRNGNVGFNQTSVNASRKVEIKQPSTYSSALRLLPEGASGDNATIEFFTGVSHYDLSVTHSTDALKFQRNGAEKMRLTNLGQLNVFTSSTSGIQARNSTAAGAVHATYIGRHSATTTLNGTVSFKVFTNGNVQNTNNSYGSLSDIKLKENIVDAASQWEDIKGIRVRKYNFKEETGHETFTQLGVIAQEVESVSPGLVTELPDTETVEVPVLDENGEALLDRNGEAVVSTEERNLDTTTKSVNYSVLYMKAVKALQEAINRIETLEAKVAALEAE